MILKLYRQKLGLFRSLFVVELSSGQLLWCSVYLWNRAKWWKENMNPVTLVLIQMLCFCGFSEKKDKATGCLSCNYKHGVTKLKLHEVGIIITWIDYIPHCRKSQTKCNMTVQSVEALKGIRFRTTYWKDLGSFCHIQKNLGRNKWDLGHICLQCERRLTEASKDKLKVVILVL